MKAASVLRRIGTILIVLWMVHLITFVLVNIVPGDAAELVAGERSTPEQVEAIRVSMGLGEPIFVQYFDSLGAVLTGDLGKSLFSGIPVTDLIADALGPTLSIAGVALIFATVLGVLAGVAAGLASGSWIDRAVSLLATLGIAMPSFWVGMVVVSLFSLTLDLFPATSYVPISEGFGPWFSHVILPAVALGLAVAAEIARHTRGGVTDVLAMPYIRTARARGAGGTTLVMTHVLRNAAIPVVTVLGLQAGRLLGGTIVVEAVFGISGLGSLAISSVLQRDYPVLQGFVLFAALVVVVINATVDSSYGWINPRVRAQ